MEKESKDRNTKNQDYGVKESKDRSGKEDRKREKKLTKNWRELESDKRERETERDRERMPEIIN